MKSGENGQRRRSIQIIRFLTKGKEKKFKEKKLVEV